MIKPKPKHTPESRKTIVSGYIEEGYKRRFLQCLHRIDPTLTVSDGIAQLIRAHVDGNDCPDCNRLDIHCDIHKL